MMILEKATDKEVMEYLLYVIEVLDEWKYKTLSHLAKNNDDLWKKCPANIDTIHIFNALKVRLELDDSGSIDDMTEELKRRCFGNPEINPAQGLRGTNDKGKTVACRMSNRTGE